MEINCPKFKFKEMIPKKYTCQGDDINPPLVIKGIPKAAKSLVLIVDDPDAPAFVWIHWVVFNIPVIKEIEEDSIPGTQGFNSFGQINYGGPCPPSGVHRYFFKIYALDTHLDIEEGVPLIEVEEAMEGHVLDSAETIGLYRKD
jgi:Raf kinase inhibitor-like YbhB/YbcL family protein